jgi:hypothetical protein
VNPRTRRRAALVLVAAALAPALPLYWAAGRALAVARWARYRFNKWNRRIPALPVDGEWLTVDEAMALDSICRGWKHTAREGSRT